ncbi:MAG: response regulator transcription factor [Nitrospirales bacterium]|nr:response regulator transcription factor [Nitrospirales bacterium]
MNKERHGQGTGEGVIMKPPVEFSHDFNGIADLRGGPGLLILSTDHRLLHMNRRGWELIRQINDSQTVTETVKAGGLLPPAVTEICTEIHTFLKTQRGSKDWEQLEVRRLVGDSKRPILLRGFGLPGSDSRVLIVMEVMGRRERVAQQIQERFQLTNREQTVVQNLAKGFTNKEIASALGITEPTVKAHIKHIMEKTKCSTRTAIVAQALHG